MTADDRTANEKARTISTNEVRSYDINNGTVRPGTLF
jgi:hypothetical protein